MPKTKTPSKPSPFLPLWTTLLLLIVWLLSGCGTPPKTLPPSPVQCVQLPPLSAAARQGEIPLVCSPTCLDALTKERENWQQSLTQAASEDSPVKPSTTAPAKP